MKRGALAIL